MKLRLRIPAESMSDEAALRTPLDLREGLKTSPYFPKIVPTVDELEGSITTFQVSVGRAASGDREEIAVKNAAKRAMLGIVRRQVLFVNLEADGDEVKLKSVNLPLISPPEPVPLGEPVVETRRGENPGELVVYTKPVPGAVSYKFEYSADPEAAQWQEILSSVSKQVISGLVLGSEVYLRITAIGRNGQTRISQVARALVS